MQNPVITVMTKAARMAGTVMLRHMSKLASLNIVEKSPQDYASEVDAAAEKEIIKELRRAYPDIAILAEESGAMGTGRQTFVIDPLDGTSNYLRGFPHFCVSIALVENGEPTDGTAAVERAADLADVTHVRWIFPDAIAPGGTRKISYRGVIK